MVNLNPFSWLMTKHKQKKQAKLDAAAQKIEDERLKKQICKILKEVPLLANLSKKEIDTLASQFNFQSYKNGENIMTKGDVGDEFFLIIKGTAEVYIDEGSCVASLEKMDYFGEQALLTDESITRNATIKATSDLEALKLNRKQFQELTSTEVMFAHRAAVITEKRVQKPTKKQDELTEDEMSFITRCIKTNILFSGQQEKTISDIVPYFFKRTYKKDDVIIKQGDTSATEFYVINQGECSVNTEKNGYIVTLSKDACFGELALMYNAPRNATIKVTSDEMHVFVMERSTFQYILHQNNKSTDDSDLEFLRGIKLLQPLLCQELILLQEALQVVKYEGSIEIFKQGDKPDKFYIVKEGVCKGNVAGSDKSESFVLPTSHFFGEIALLNDEPRKATIMTGEEGCTLLELSREDFGGLLGPLKTILDRNAQEYVKPVSERKLLTDSATTICDLEDLKTIGLLGRGAFGKVTLVIDPTTEKSYALKAIKKTQIEELGQSSHIVNEKKVMMTMSNRFLVNLRRTYKDAWRVYFLVDVCLGGELFTILRKKRSFDEDHTRFYAGCVVEAFSYMHGMDIIYRDLKPENLVMDENGYVKVTDFGFAKVVPKKTYTLCGTPDYLAPEIVTGQGHGKGVDWWCLGVLIYELLSSFPPFFDDEPMGTYRKIIQGKFKFPKYFSVDARDIIARLLRTKPTKRLAVLKGGADNIRKHIWYSQVKFQWDDLREGQLKPPFKPKVKSIDDISNFDQRDRNASADFSGKPPLTPWDVDF